MSFSLALPFSAICKYFRTYPRITGTAAICSYYRKRCHTIPVFLMVFAMGIVFSQLTRLVVYIFTGVPLWTILDAIQYFVLTDMTTISTAYYVLSVANNALQKVFKQDFQRLASVQFTFQAAALVPTIIFMTVPFFMRHLIPDNEAASYTWTAFFIMQIQVCTWLADGILYRIFLMSLYDVVSCWIFVYQNKLAIESCGRIVSCNFLTAVFFIAFDKYIKENFLLKHLLKQQKKVYESFLENVKEPVLILENSRVLFGNDASRSTFGSGWESFNERAGQLVCEAGPSLQENVARRLRQDELSADCIKTERYCMREPPDGGSGRRKRTVFIITLIESRCLGTHKTIAVSLHDLSHEITLEERRIGDKYKNMLLFSLSHELKTPLNIFQAFLSLSKQYMLTNEQGEMRREAKAAWQYLRNKISDILDYTQLMNREFALHPSKFSLRRLVELLRKVALGLLQRRRETVALDFAVDKFVADPFVGDRDRLEQVLFNFISNSVKYTVSGKISLRVYGCVENGAMMTRFEVSDTGCGMSPERLASLFALKECHSPFQGSSFCSAATDSSPSDKKSQGLSGLGLTVSQLICEKMGTDIRVTSFPNKGSTFSFALPMFASRSIAEAEASPSVRPMRKTTGSELEIPNEPSSSSIYDRAIEPSIARMLRYVPTRTTPRTTTVLVVDDNDLNRFVTKSMVGKFGFRVLEADNGSLAVEKTEELQRDRNGVANILILMDVDMPVMDGIEATVRIRRADRRPRPYIVALTAFSAESERAKCMGAGMDGFIGKPLTKDALDNMLAQLALIS